VRDLMESMVDGERTAREVSEILEINCALIERVADRMAEQRNRCACPTPSRRIRSRYCSCQPDRSRRSDIINRSCDNEYTYG